MRLLVATKHRQPDHADEVSRVTCRRQNTETLRRLIDRALVAVTIEDLNAGLHPDVRHLGEEHLRL